MSAELPPSALPATENEAPTRRPSARAIGIGALLALGLVALLILSLGSDSSVAGGGGSVLLFAPAAFLAGVFSFLSPCTLPILPAYFAFTFQARRERIVLMTVSFFLGLATTMVMLGTITSAISQFLIYRVDKLTLIGGVIVVILGVMSFFGKGFTGVKLLDRPSASAAGSYLYGATFALGWSACVGPILGALYTLMASQGIGVLQGAVLSFIYAMGLGMPLIIIATFFSKLGRGSRFWTFIRGRAFEIPVGGTTIMLHTTSMASGLLLIFMGALLATGQMSVISQWAAGTPLARWAFEIETWLSSVLIR